MTYHRFFLPRDAIEGDAVRFHQGQARQIRTVLRLQPGERVTVLDGSGIELVVRLEDVQAGTGTVEERHPNRAEPSASLVLYQGLLKGAKLEMVLQKCTEIGVAGFVPMLTARSVPAEPGTAKQRRYGAIVAEASEQSGRGRVPEIRPVTAFRSAIRDAAGTLVLPWEGERAVHLESVPLGRGRTVSLFIGPEGGLTEEEVAEARDAGAHVVTLGRRILRAETAAIVATALILAELGELG